MLKVIVLNLINVIEPHGFNAKFRQYSITSKLIS